MERNLIIWYGNLIEIGMKWLELSMGTGLGTSIRVGRKSKTDSCRPPVQHGLSLWMWNENICRWRHLSNEFWSHKPMTVTNERYVSGQLAELGSRHITVRKLSVGLCLSLYLWWPKSYWCTQSCNPAWGSAYSPGCSLWHPPEFYPDISLRERWIIPSDAIARWASQPMSCFFFLNIWAYPNVLCMWSIQV